MATTHPRTFVRTVKAEAVCFDPIEDTLEQIRHKRSPDWAIFGFADQHESRNTLKVLAVGDGDLSDRSQWPPELFAPNALCYGFLRFEFAEGETFAPVFVSFCWKGRSLPIYLRTKYAEFNHVIRKHLKATNHMTLQHPDELAEGTFWQNMPPTTPRRKRSNSRRFVTNEIEFTSEVLQAVKDIRTDAAPFNWMVCGYDISECDGSVQKITVIDKGMAGLHALKGLGGITAILRDGVTMYLYLRVDIPIFHNAERIVPKFVLVTWQGVDNGLFSDDESLEGWNLSPLSDGNGPPLSSGSLRDLLPPTPSNSIVQRVMTAQKHGSEVTRFFPHHVHFSANSIMEITEETIRERVRRAVDNDCMLLRVVCIQRSGDTQSPICIEVPFDATVGLLRKEIASFVGIPEQQQQIVWIRQMDDFVNEFQRSTRAIVFNDDGATLRTDIGLGHGDKIHVGDNADGADSILDKLVKQINSGTVNVSLSAERRHEVQKGVEAREAELKKILSATHDLLRKRAGTRAKLRHVETAPVEPVTEATIPTPDITQVEVAAEPEANDASDQQNGSTSPQGSQSDASEDESNLQEKARVLEEQNEYLEVPKESIRILGGKENELGCGKAATVYRGLWLNKNGAAEVAIKLFRYVRLTDKILGDYTKEVALLRKLKHPNIVLFIGACTDSKLMILTEYCSRKSLYEVIHTPNFATIPWQYKVRMMLDAARGIQYLHSRRIIHRDIKSHNFLVDDDWRVKVADFGISKILENDATAYTQCGTTGWVAPEVLLDEDVGYTFKADNWSFAVVMWEMVADGLQNQFIGMAPIKFYNQTVHAGIRPPFPESVDPDYVALINECWHSNASDRPPFGEIVSRLEQMVLKIGGSIDLPPTYQGGYHHCLTNGE